MNSAKMIAPANYPKLLREIPNPPKQLYYKGDINLIHKPCISIVGTRKFSGYGEEMTEKIIQELSVLDICIVSGLALGIDSIAHRTAMECDLPTIAVLGSGIDNIYPSQNFELAEEIQNLGLIISEYPDLTDPIKTNFPQRNRIVSGLSIATILIEAPEKSGALITAKLAVEQNRELFIVPGDVDRENSIGPIKFLQEIGGYPITSGLEVIDILHQQPHLFNIASKQRKPLRMKDKIPPEINNLSPIQEMVFALIPKHRGLDIETLDRKCQLPIRELLQAITMLEIKRLITTKSGKYYRSC